jgi:hypothetical protein
LVFRNVTRNTPFREFLTKATIRDYKKNTNSIKVDTLLTTQMYDEKVITNPANTVFPINELIKKRWSARAFSTKSVEKVKLLSMLEAARWAPSSNNEQPWRYIVFTNECPDKLEKAQEVLLEFNSCKKSTNINMCHNKKNLF